MVPRWFTGLLLMATACGRHHGDGNGDAGGGDAPSICPCDASGSQDALVDSPASSRSEDAPVDSPASSPDARVMATMQVGSAGGTLTTAEGVKLVVPPGALASTTTITITQLTNNLPSNALGNVYDLEPSGTQFSTPVQLTLPYDPAKLGSTPVTDIAVGYDDGQGHQRGTGWSLIDPTDHLVTAYITHFSQWSVFPAPPGGCSVNYGCMKQCAGVDVPDLCCNTGRSTCRSNLTTSLPTYVNCYTSCTGANQLANFGNSECMTNCCTSAGWTELSQGACYSATATQSEAQSILDCAAQCPASGDRGTFCGPIDFTSCEWDMQNTPNMGDECDGPNSGGINSQILLTGLGPVADQIWGNPQVIHVVSGSYTSTSLTLSLTCATAVNASGSMTATWNASQFSGNWTFGSASGTFTVSPKWPQN